uniref:uncharacterized protein LOC120338062 n=1 Tax=Styela clava TaxID=7725 RepID=UPI0019394FEF|nr:uncharacterized protein LOC120338062 [Styela clava]
MRRPRRKTQVINSERRDGKTLITTVPFLLNDLNYVIKNHSSNKAVWANTVTKKMSRVRLFLFNLLILFLIAKSIANVEESQEYQAEFDRTFTCDDVVRIWKGEDYASTKPSEEFIKDFEINFGEAYRYGGPGPTIATYDVMEIVTLPTIKQFLVTACSLRKRILNATAHDIMESYLTIKEIRKVEYEGGWGPNTHGLLGNSKKPAEYLWYMRKPSTNDLMHMLRTFFCIYRTCNVGICKIGSAEFSEAHYETARIELLTAWRDKIKALDEDIADEVVMVKMLKQAIVLDEKTEADLLKGELLSYWINRILMLDGIITIMVGIEQNPTKENFMKSIWDSTICECLDGYGGRMCNVCPTENILPLYIFNKF